MRGETQDRRRRAQLVRGDANEVVLHARKLALGRDVVADLEHSNDGAAYVDDGTERHSQRDMRPAVEGLEAFEVLDHLLTGERAVDQIQRSSTGTGLVGDGVTAQPDDTDDPAPPREIIERLFDAREAERVQCSLIEEDGPRARVEDEREIVDRLQRRLQVEITRERPRFEHRQHAPASLRRANAGAIRNPGNKSFPAGGAAGRLSSMRALVAMFPVSEPLLTDDLRRASARPRATE